MRPRVVSLVVMLLLLGFSCVTYGPGHKWPKPHQDELLHYCWIPGEMTPRWPERCNETGTLKYLEWDHAPITVTTTDDMAGVVTDAVEVWNKWVGFELFVYKRLDPSADTLILAGGPNLWWRGVAKHYLKNGRLRGGVLIFDGAMGDVGTMAHELGHIVGLAHDSNNWHSIMYPNSRRALPGLERIDRYTLRRKYLKLAAPRQ